MDVNFPGIDIAAPLRKSKTSGTEVVVQSIPKFIMVNFLSGDADLKWIMTSAHPPP